MRGAEVIRCLGAEGLRRSGAEMITCVGSQRYRRSGVSMPRRLDIAVLRYARA